MPPIPRPSHLSLHCGIFPHCVSSFHVVHGWRLLPLVLQSAVTVGPFCSWLHLAMAVVVINATGSIVFCLSFRQRSLWYGATAGVRLGQFKLRFGKRVMRGYRLVRQ